MQFLNRALDARHARFVVSPIIVGHQTESMRRRYRHLYPEVKANAVNSASE
jgi:hypothetical protein